jgi:hypothetical protein
VSWWVEILGFAATLYCITISWLIVTAGMYIQVFRVIDNRFDQGTIYKLIYFMGMSVVLGAAFYLMTKNDDDIQT